MNKLEVIAIVSVGMIGLLALAAVPNVTLAVPEVQIAPLNEGNTAAPVAFASVTGIKDVLINVIKWVYTIFYVVTVLFILLAAFNYLQGGTNPEKVKTAKAQLKYAVIAIVIALVASGVTLLLQRFLGSYGVM
jgi:hypothetical protein